MRDYLDAVVPSLSEALVTPAARRRVVALAATLPAVSMGGLECRLGAREARVDFHLGYLRQMAPPLPDDYRSHAGWQFVEALCRAWVEPDSVLHRNVTTLILEFDVLRRPARVPIPAPFVGLGAADRASLKAVTECVLALLGVTGASGVRSTLGRCLERLPDGATVSHLGAMASRSADLFRLNVAGVSPVLLADYLDGIGWRGSLTAIQTLIRDLSPCVDAIELALDVSDAVSPRIGLECFLKNQPREDARWLRLLDYLVARRLCSPGKRDGLLAWPGVVQRTSQPEAWPTHLNLSERLFSDRARSVLVRRLNHVKLVIEPGSATRAKAYLGFGHYWIDHLWTEGGATGLAVALSR